MDEIKTPEKEQLDKIKRMRDELVLQERCRNIASHELEAEVLKYMILTDAAVDEVFNLETMSIEKTKK